MQPPAKKLIYKSYPILIVLILHLHVPVLIAEETGILQKCCPPGEGLFIKEEGAYTTYDCVAPEDTQVLNEDMKVKVPLMINRPDVVVYGYPKSCEVDQLIHSRYSLSLNVSRRYCLDKLFSNSLKEQDDDDYDGDILSVLSCDTGEDNVLVQVGSIRKCCPDGKVYNRRLHYCLERNYNRTPIFDRLSENKEIIYDVSYGMDCEPTHIVRIYDETSYSLKIIDNHLYARNKINNEAKVFNKGRYCVDEMDDMVLYAMSCEKNSCYGGACVRKCCPIGEHHEPRTCGRQARQCVPGDIQMELEFYTKLFKGYARAQTPETYDLKYHLSCEHGRYLANMTSEHDIHYLTKDGLYVPFSNEYQPTDGYCIEMVDFSKCNDDGGIYMDTVLCMIDAPDGERTQYVFSFVIICISAVFLALTLVLYLILPELRNVHGLSRMCHIACMFVGYCCLARAQYRDVSDPVWCKVLGYVIYFSFVGAFSWLNIMCFDMWWTFGSMQTRSFKKSSSERRRFIYYSSYAWGLTIIMTSLLLFFDYYPFTNVLDANIGHNYCWFESAKWPHLIFFIIPIGILIFVNTILWIGTARHCSKVKSELYKVQSNCNEDKAHKRFRADRAKYLLTMRMFVVMGVSWTWEIVSTVVKEPKWLWTICDCVNLLQGVFMFAILVLRPNLLRIIKKKLGMTSGDGNTSSSGGRTTLSWVSNNAVSVPPGASHERESLTKHHAGTSGGTCVPT